MMELIAASDCQRWRNQLASFERFDVCHFPEYHLAYSRRFEGAQPLMWCYQSAGEKLCYPFLLSPVRLSAADANSVDTGFYDISGIYGYSGPLSTSADSRFLAVAWEEFDRWAMGKKVISEFIRFSTFVDNRALAHPLASVEYNRPVSLAALPDDADVYFGQLDSKTRNMIRKAMKSGLRACQVDVREASILSEFRKLYADTMLRNQASDFFGYDDRYYELLLRLSDKELVLYAVYQGEQMVAAAMGLVNDDMAFYHLGASTLAASRLGAGNLVLFTMAKALIDRKVGLFSVGGGRTTAADDALFRFKKSNGTAVGDFYIGKRILQQTAYDRVVEQWQVLNGQDLVSRNLQFYR